MMSFEEHNSNCRCKCQGLDHTLVRTERGFATMNLKNCGRYLRSPSPSLYNAVHTNLNLNTNNNVRTQNNNDNVNKISSSDDEQSLRVSSEFLHIMLNNEVVTPSGAYGLHRRFRGLQQHKPLPLCLHLRLKSPNRWRNSAEFTPKPKQSLRRNRTLIIMSRTSKLELLLMLM